jgi:hypothetical protein
MLCSAPLRSAALLFLSGPSRGPPARVGYSRAQEPSRSLTRGAEQAVRAHGGNQNLCWVSGFGGSHAARSGAGGGAVRASGLRQRQRHQPANRSGAGTTTRAWGLLVG